MDQIDTDNTVCFFPKQFILGIPDKQKTITNIITIFTNQFIEDSKFTKKTTFFEHLNLNIHKYYNLKRISYCNKKGTSGQICSCSLKQSREKQLFVIYLGMRICRCYYNSLISMVVAHF